MNLHELELLAPAGRMDVLHSVIEAGADAVYLGGKRFNMRGRRSDYNFSDAELEQAVKYVHGRQRRLYITLNNLYYSDEIDDIVDYLVFLRALQVDALIVQDLGIATLCEELQLGIPLHASVQMGIANLQAVKLLEDRGFARAILSKNVSLTEIAAISAGTAMGIEFFVQGDLCVAHTGQCYMSSIMTGEHGNRGKCSKPCRWQYQLLGGDQQSEQYRYHLAHKDMCLYPYLKQMVDAGVTSFKIEGRMRSARYLEWLVSTYRRALDRLIAAPDDYSTDDKEIENLYENRIRNYTTGNLLKPLDWTVIDFQGEREPVQSQAQVLPRLEVEGRLPETIKAALPAVPELTVKVGGLEALEKVMPLQIGNLILGSETIRQNKQNWTASAVLKAARLAQETRSRLFLETPRIVSQNDLPAIMDLKRLAVQSGIDGIIVNDLGSLRIFRDTGLQIWAGYGLNIFNHAAGQFLIDQGIQRITASIELGRPHVLSLLQTGTPSEIMVHGPLPCMVSDYCMIRAAHAERDDECPCYCIQGEFYLRDAKGQQYRIVSDADCRTYLHAPYDLCLLPYLYELAAGGARSFRIEGQFYQPAQLHEIVTAYQEALACLVEGKLQSPGLYARLASVDPSGWTAGAYLHDPS